MSDQTTHKTCFVTIGATASFSELIKAVLSADFYRALESQNYTDVIVQYGQDGEKLYAESIKRSGLEESTIKTTGFGIDEAGLGPYMRLAKGNVREKKAVEGVVISHAGSGTILDALRISVPLIVVPNPTLLDNHQLELAEALAEQEYVVHGKLEDLTGALEAAEKLRIRSRQWPPVNSGVHRQAKGLKGVLDEEMGLLD